MTTEDSMSIGAFARRSGITASALRFYDDAGVLRPEHVDPVTGYRFYDRAQIGRATQVRQLREMGMPLASIQQFLTAEPATAVRMIDDHIAKVVSDAEAAQRVATTLKAAVSTCDREAICVVHGPVLADAVDQILAATVNDPGMPVLGGVRLEAAPDGVTLVATDRYRLTTRSLTPVHASGSSWGGTLVGDDLRALTSRFRRSRRVGIESASDGLRFDLSDVGIHGCRVHRDDFPDFRLMIESLPAVTHRVVVEKQRIIGALEAQAVERTALLISDGNVCLASSDGTDAARIGSAEGSDLTVWFALTTLYPAVSQAIGPDVMIDLRGSDQPATIRSANDGDLTTLAMPCHV